MGLAGGGTLSWDRKGPCRDHIVTAPLGLSGRVMEADVMEAELLAPHWIQYWWVGVPL